MSFVRRLLSHSWPVLLGLAFAPVSWPQDAAPPASSAVSSQVRITTSAGAFTIQLDAMKAPLSTANFLQYVRDGHYDGTIFHRVIGNFMIQGGGFTAAGKEKPVRAAIANESGNGLSNRRGTVAMARIDDPHSATAQFFVNLVDNHALDPSPSRWGYAVFGVVIDGMDTVDRISGAATGQFGPFAEDAPLQPIVIESARVVGDPAPAK